MTTQHPAGDGDTRPTDRERLTDVLSPITARADAIEKHGRNMQNLGAIEVSVPLLAAAETMRRAVADALLAARAPAPPDAAKALRDAVRKTIGPCDRHGRGDGPGACLRHQEDRLAPCQQCQLTAALVAERLAAEPDAATRTVQEQWAVDGDGYDMERRNRDDAMNIAAGHPSRHVMRREVTTSTTPWRAAADPGTRGEGHDRG